MGEQSAELSMRLLAGESVIDHPPLFSLDGEILFIIRERTVRAYSTITGERVCDLQKANANIVNIQNNPHKPLYLYGCTVDGEIISWDYKTWSIHKTVKIKLMQSDLSTKIPIMHVQSFHLVPYMNNTFGFLTMNTGSQNLAIGLFDLKTGSQEKIRLASNIAEQKGFSGGDHKVAVSKNNEFYTVAIIQHQKVLVANYVMGYCKCYKSAGNIKLNVVACHPEKEIIATGDEDGRIFFYFSLYSKDATSTKYHWNHNPLQALAFSASGSIFYTGGSERVLIGWNFSIETCLKNNFLPRISGNIVHIAVSENSQKIAVTTDDNAISLFNPQFKLLSYIQTFTFCFDDKTPWPKFPIGLKIDPRTSSIVLNGRVGQLQFCSSHTRSILNFDTTVENRLSLEKANILYNTRITQSALNMDWLVTAESLDDLEHFPEVRLKFWKFDTVKQSYVLNTQIETPHEGGVTALAFSSSFSTDNLLCASSGMDRQVKVWSLQETTNIGKTGKYWVCLQKTGFKNLAVKSLAFSQDGSLLAVGFGNTLCIYIPETLHIKCMLSTPAGLDGSVNKLIVNIPTTSLKSKSPSKEKHRTELSERRQHVLKMVKDYLENKNDKLLTEIIENSKKIRVASGPSNGLSPSDLSVQDKELIFKAILGQNELNFFQKLEVFQKLEIHVRVPVDLRDKFNEYIEANVSVGWKENDLLERSKNLSQNSRFIACSKLANYQQRRDKDIIDNGLHLKNVTFDDEKMNSNKQKKQSQNEAIQAMEINDKPSDRIYPIKKVAQINHVVFATSRDLSHFVIVCTEKRLLIWNVLTLRLHAAFKLSVQHITVDPYTSLVAAFTCFNELYVFLPNSQYTRYVQKNMPAIHGVVWVPRRHPRPQSLDVNWQAISQLYFFTHKQELMYLADENDDDSATSRATTLNENLQLHPQTLFGAMIAKHITDDTVSLPGPRTNGGARFGEFTKENVKSVSRNSVI